MGRRKSLWCVTTYCSTLAFSECLDLCSRRPLSRVLLIAITSNISRLLHAFQEVLPSLADALPQHARRHMCFQLDGALPSIINVFMNTFIW